MTRAQACFEAWAKHTRSSWEWDYLDQPTKQAWELAAQAAVAFIADGTMKLDSGRVARMDK